MDAFTRARHMMVDGQIRVNDVTNPNLIAAFLDLPREKFLPAAKAELAYLDSDLAVSVGDAGQPSRFLLKPMVLGKLIETAAVTAKTRALDIGCATGYSTAVLSRLAASVIGLEEDADLAAEARDNLAALGVMNATAVAGPLAAGAAGEGPYDVILINGAVEFVPDALMQQLAEGGRLVCVLRRGPAGKGMVYLKAGAHAGGRPVFDAAAPLLPGFARAHEFVF